MWWQTPSPRRSRGGRRARVHGYHVHTFGFLVGEIVRRVTGIPVEAMLEREIAGPLGAEVSFGVARAKRQRCAEYDFGEVVAETPPTPDHRGISTPPPT